MFSFAGALARALLETAFPADCLACDAPLPWRQRGGVCPGCWERLPWAPARRGLRGPLADVAWALPYRDAPRTLIRALKFERFDPLGAPLGREAARRALSARAGLDLADAVVVPVPLHWTRRVVRGFNQAELLARGVAAAIDRPLDPSLLRRARRGRRQLGLTRRERRRSLVGVFAARGARGRRVLLVDDVVTTGATLEACAEALSTAGARSVIAFAIARTEPLSPP